MSLFRKAKVARNSIDAATLGKLPVSDIRAVVFFKQDELTTDLICCEIESNGQTWFFHEKMEGWGLLLDHLLQLPGFDLNWFAQVSQPPFAPSVTVAFRRDEDGDLPKQQ